MPLYTFRANGKIYRVRKAPTEPDDDAAERGWWIANQPGSSQTHVELYSQSFQYIQTKNLGMTW